MQVKFCDCSLSLCVQPAETCIHYPVQSYLLVLMPPSEQAFCFTLGCNETETFVNGLEDNKMYSYFVTAINRIGNATTNSDNILSEFNSQLVLLFNLLL